MTADDEQLCARLEATGWTDGDCYDRTEPWQAAARIRALSARLEAAEKMAEALKAFLAGADAGYVSIKVGLSARQVLAARETYD